MRLAAGLLALVLGPPAAVAGPLSKVVHGIDARAGGDRGDRSGPSQGRGDDDSGPSQSSDHDSGSSGGEGYGYGYGYVGGSDWRGGGVRPSGGGETDVEIYLGLHRVAEETGAAVVSLRAAYDDFALELGAQSYVENAGHEVITLGIWSLGGGYRIIDPTIEAPTAVWLTASVAGLSTEESSLLGAALGAKLRHHLAGALGVVASARLLSFQEGIGAVEARAGVAASLLRVSYRYLQFDVGPPLHGPEVGFALRF